MILPKMESGVVLLQDLGGVPENLGSLSQGDSGFEEISSYG